MEKRPFKKISSLSILDHIVLDHNDIHDPDSYTRVNEGGYNFVKSNISCLFLCI